MSLNSISNADVISIGDVLKLDNSTASQAEAKSQPTIENSMNSSSNLSSSDSAAKEEIARRESNGSCTAQNGQYYGRYQLSQSYLNGDLSPENQEKVADNYVASRYGSWSAALSFWNSNGWY